tara:strand:- start:19503 stop:20345 length:843 start_codon:yes stop_codon:yes gene_type:complete
MTKNIDTLIPDIYNMLEQGVDTDNAEMDKFLDDFASQVREAASIILQEGKREGKTNLRLSQIGKPDRQIWYGVKGVEGQPLSGQTRIKFLMGHLLEAVLIMLTKAAGHSVEAEQEEVTVEGVLGHQDCIIDGVLTDIKSASSFAFKKFRDNKLAEDDPFGYIAQISAYATRRGDKEAAFFAIDKNSGELAITKVHDLEMIDANARVNYLKGIIDTDTPPPRCYNDVPDGKSGNRKLTTGCTYCGYKTRCWDNLRAFKYSNGVRILTHVAKTPDVEEVAVG